MKIQGTLSALLVAAVTMVVCCQAVFKPREDDDEIRFVFELNRHGARAPTDGNKGFTVSAGILTPQGMRQRFLLGKANMQRYSEEYSLLDPSGPVTQVASIATDVQRTIQSGQSELLGMFVPDQQTAPSLTPNQQRSLARGGKGSPPLRVRNTRVINEQLTASALPDGFRAQSIRTWMEVAISDDVDCTGCDYVQKVDGYRFPAESTYTNVEWLKDDLREPIATCFNLTDYQRENMSFMDLYGHCDTIQSRVFENLESCNFFNQTQMDQVNQTVLATLVLPLDDPELSREMYISKQLRVPLFFMENEIEGIGLETDPRFVQYSTHDWTVSTMLEFLNATNGNFTVVPFASSVHFELHSTRECDSVDCFWVEIYFNSKPLTFEDICENAAKCTYTEFIAMLESRNFVSSQTHYKTECAKPWSPESQSLSDFELAKMRAFYEKHRLN